MGAARQAAAAARRAGQAPRGRLERARDWMWIVLNQEGDPRYRRFLWFISALIVVSVAIVFYEHIFHPPATIQAWLLVVDYVIITIFGLEYLARLWVIRDWRPTTVKLGPLRTLRFFVSSRLRFILSPWGLIDLAALMPLFTPLRSLRVLRLLRLLRSVKLFRYTNPMSTLFAAFRDNSLLFLFTLSFLIGAVSLAAVMVYLAEYQAADRSIRGLGEALWWAIVTITTVGYGDLTPTQPAGKVIGVGLMFSGMFIIAMLAGVISSTLVDHLIPLRMEQVRMSTLSDHLIIAGWNETVPMLLEQLGEEYDEGKMPAVVVFAPRDRPETLDSRFQFVHGDFTKEVEYEKVRLSFGSVVVVVADNSTGATRPASKDATAVLTVFTIRRLEKRLRIERTRPLHVCCEILDPENIEHARVAGADEVIPSALLSNSLLAHTASNPGVSAALSHLVMATNQNLYTHPLPQLVPGGQPLRFRSLLVKGQEELGVMIVGIHLEGQPTLNPSRDLVVEQGTPLVYIGQRRHPMTAPSENVVVVDEPGGPAAPQADGTLEEPSGGGGGSS